MGFDNLPEHVVVHICGHVSSSSLEDFFNLRSVSRSFKRLCEDPYVMSMVNLEEVPLIPWVPFREWYFKLLRRCWECGNPEAIFRHGFLCYFRDARKPEGLDLLINAKEKGNREAAYVLGLIYFCDTGETTKAFENLSSLTYLLMSTTSEELDAG